MFSTASHTLLLTLTTIVHYMMQQVWISVNFLHFRLILFISSWMVCGLVRDTFSGADREKNRELKDPENEEHGISQKREIKCRGKTSHSRQTMNFMEINGNPDMLQRLINNFCQILQQRVRRSGDHFISIISKSNCISVGSSVSIVSGYGLDDRAIEVRSPAGAKDFSSSPCVQTGSGAHPASCTMGTGASSPGLKRGRGVTLTTHPHLVPRLSMSRSYTSSPSKRLYGV
jgi:hypothetical protein